MAQVFKTKASFAMIAEIVERTPEIPNRGGRRLDRINGQVDLSKLRFKYPTRDALVLNDLSLSVKPGQTVALVPTHHRFMSGHHTMSDELTM